MLKGNTLADEEGMLLFPSLCGLYTIFIVILSNCQFTKMKLKYIIIK
jgi:hypothetical protein